MVAEQLVARGIREPRVLSAMRRVPRHRFVPAEHQERAYGDHPIEIGLGQTISQPYIVAFMTEALDVRPGDRVLEIGTGSGYQTAILSTLGARVHTIERLATLSDAARQRLEELGYGGIQWRVGDGSEGWAERGPFDRIIVTAGAPSVPVSLAAQMAPEGRMVIPIGPLDHQDLVLYVRERGLITRHPLCEVVFVKLVGREGWENP